MNGMADNTYIKDTEKEFSEVRAICRDIFEKKLFDYGTSWRIMRPESITDQIYIKAMRIRSIQEKGVAQVNEGVEPEFIGIVNYSAIGLIQLQLGSGSQITPEEALHLYEVPFIDSRSYSTCHCCSIQEFFPCTHIFEAFPYFLLYKFQCLWFYVEFLNPLRFDLSTRR